MAEVDFGDSELFEQLGDFTPRLPKHSRFTYDEEEQEDMSQLRSRLEDCEEYNRRLTEENKSLKRKQSILMRPSGITVEDVNVDGPVLQIIYTNNALSKHCRQEIEDCICSVIAKHQIPGTEKMKSTFHMKPQNSSFAMDEEQHTSSPSTVKTTTEAFKVVGSVSYFTTFCLDKLGQPLMNENPQLTDGWDIPVYHQIFNQVIGADGLEIEMKDKRPKFMCFNCGLSGHQLRDCPKPKDMAAINERRKEFNQNNNQAIQGHQRYHTEEVEERFAKYKPGVMSEELLSALGIDGNTLPPLIYRMRQLGYSPGWLKEAEMENSGLTLYDGNVSNDGNEMSNISSQNISYDVSKLIDFPGFNVPAPHRMRDEFLQYGSIPIQSTHMKPNFAAYLSKNFPMPGAACSKRPHESDSSPKPRKKTRTSPGGSSDMDIESDPGIPYPHDFHFQPPLAPSSPCFSSPPPLPQGTPPATPTPPPLPKGTPPLTPSNGSPEMRGKNWRVIDEAVEGTEDELTLEELEEQQRLIWAALEKAETAPNSDCETPALGTPVSSSESLERYAQEVGPVENDSSQSPEPVRTQEDTPQSPGPVRAQEDTPQSPGPVRAQEDTPQSPCPVRAQEDTPQSPGPVRTQEDTPQSPGPVRAREDTPQSPETATVQDGTSKSPGPVKAQEDSRQSPSPIECQVDNPQSPVSDSGGAIDCASEDAKKATAVPHRSNFAAGIVPFEDTPEYTEVAAATGTYLKIRDLLKCSPRNLAKKKKLTTMS